MSFRSAVLFSLLSALALAIAMLIFGCHAFEREPPRFPNERALARGALEATARAVAAADEACAVYGTATRDVALLRSCEAHYNAARGALLPAGTALDRWERVESHRSVTCALVQAVGELEQLGRDLSSRGAPSPPVLADARALVSALGGCPDV